MDHDTETLEVTLPKDVAKMIRRKVDQGGYRSDEDVIREGLRLLQERDALEEQEIASIRAKIGESLDDPRPTVPAEEAFDKLLTKYRKMAEQPRGCRG